MHRVVQRKQFTLLFHVQNLCGNAVSWQRQSASQDGSFLQCSRKKLQWITNPPEDITRSNSESTISYQMSSVPLGIVSCHKCLGICIQDDLQWDTQVREVKSKASKILGLLPRNLSSCSTYVKEQAYNSLVRSRVEYASPCWSPFEKQHITSIESIQRAAASDYSSYSSVTGMTHSLG